MAYEHLIDEGLILDTSTGWVYDDTPNENGEYEYIGTEDEIFGPDDTEFGSDPFDFGPGPRLADEIADLRDRIAELRENDALENGYALAREEDAEQEEAELRSEEAFADALQRLADNLGRPLSTADAENIDNLLPRHRAYSDDDVREAAKAAEIRSFTEPGAKGRQARAEYLQQRAQELENHNAKHVASGGFDPVDNGMGMYETLFTDEQAPQDRLAQSTASPDN